MKLLVTGADGFVGSWLTRRLLAEGHDVVGAVRPGDHPQAAQGRLPRGLPTVPLELRDAASVAAVVREPYDAVVHLAAVASGSEALRDVGAAWEVNATGTARMVDLLGRQREAGRRDPLVLLVSTGEVYGAGPPRPRVESDPPAPRSPYGASKLAAEIAGLEAHRRTGLRVVIARAFAHTGPGQDDRFVVPAFVRRLVTAKRIGAPAVKVGNLDPVRELLHVSDVIDAYRRLLQRGEAGQVYNVASGEPVALADLLQRLMEIVGHRVVFEVDPNLVRVADIPYLVGDGTKLRRATGWTPQRSLQDTLVEMVDAEAH